MSKISILWVSQEISVLDQNAAFKAWCNQTKPDGTRDCLNYSLLTATKETTGLQLARQHFPQVIICELSSSEINGYSFLKQIRQNQNTSTIPVIFLSKTFDTYKYRKAMEMGADDILFAPYSQLDLEKAIAARLTRQKVLLKRAQKELEQLRYSITAFLPHEILTALTGIIAGTELILNSSIPLDSCVIKELLNCINSSSKRLSRLAKNFLLYSELKAYAEDSLKIQNLRNQKTDSAEQNIAQISLRQTHLYHRQKDLNLNLQKTSVNIGTSYLKKLVEELTDNACKFSKQGTPIKICSRIQDNYLLLSISDQGRGMTSQQIQQIGFGIQFERSFYEQQGFGLGLALAKNIVKLHGGQLQISSIPQQSTTITLTLPIPRSSPTKKLNIVSSRC